MKTDLFAILIQTTCKCNTYATTTYLKHLQCDALDKVVFL